MQQQAFAVQEASQVGQVRRVVAQQAALLGLDEVSAGRAALVATELGHNLVRHAREGWLLVGRRAGRLELLALDHGPGMADTQGCLRDGYSTHGTPGTGFGAVQRQSDDFGVYSRAGVGTVVLARIAGKTAADAGPAGDDAFAWGLAGLPAPGETESGDAAAIAVDGPGASVLMLDGLGHGPQAAAASRAGIAAFERAPFEPLPRLLEQVHLGLQGSRGAAGSALRLDARTQRVHFAGVGNVAGRLISGTSDRSLLAGHGTLGLQARRTTEQVLEWPAHALAVLHSDGLATRWTLDDEPGLLVQDPSIIAAWLLRRHRRGRDDTLVAVIRRSARGTP